MNIAPGMGKYGYDATGGDSYAALDTAISAPTGNTEYWHIIVYTSGSNGAQLSFDGGTTDGPFLPGTGTLALDNVRIPGPIHAKNLSAGSNYSGLHIFVW